jgi:hypothetical protein
MNKQANADKIKKYLNLFLNPFEHQNLPRSREDKSFSTSLKHAGGLALGFGTLGVLARKMQAAKEKAERKESQEKIKAYIQAKNPIISLDESTRDPVRERKLKELGVKGIDTELIKSAAVDPARNPKIHPSAQGLALLAALGGGYAGYRLADKKEDVELDAEIEERIAERENEIDRLLLEEYKRSRDKVASSDRYEGGQGIVNKTKSLYSLYAILAMAASYKAAKGHFDKKDPQRARMDELKKIMEEKSRIQGLRSSTIAVI